MARSLRLRRSLRQAGLVAACAGVAVLLPMTGSMPGAQGRALAATPAPSAAAQSSSSAASATGAAAALATGPQLTVVGFGVVDVSPSGGPNSAPPPVINVDLSVNAPTATAALSRLQEVAAALRTRLKQASVPVADITEAGPPNLNGNAGSASYEAGVSMLVTSASLPAAAHLIDRLHMNTNPNVNNVWIDPGNGGGTPSAKAIRSAYATAFAEAHAAGLVMAAADQLTLGAQVAAKEGAALAAPSCTGTTGCGTTLAPGLAQPPLVGPDQQMVAVTVTYATTPAQAS